MRIYVVSCDKGRQERLLRAAAPLNLDIEIVDSPLSTEEEVVRRGNTCFERKTAYPTGVAATLGHIRAMVKFLETGEPLGVIIEDDVRFHKLFNEKLKILEAYTLKNIEKFDVFSIGFCSKPFEVTPYEPIGGDMNAMLTCNMELSNPWGAQCYIITRKYARFFTELFSIEDDLSIPYPYQFVTDCVIFDPERTILCRRNTLQYPIAIEDPTEQTLAGNANKRDMFKFVHPCDFYMLS
jgi:GR25 family glycosyltransferase involved in LPS biosynthesis